jgi:hypothetical protein
MMATKPLYQAIAGALIAMKNCQGEHGSPEWEEKHRRRVEWLVANHLPSGSGFNSGTTIDVEASTGEDLVLHTSFHHMTEHGYYDGWTEHPIRVRPSLYFQINLTIHGRNRNDIKDYIHEVFEHALTTLVEEFPEMAEAIAKAKSADVVFSLKQKEK